MDDRAAVGVWLARAIGVWAGIIGTAVTAGVAVRLFGLIAG